MQNNHSLSIHLAMKWILIHCLQNMQCGYVLVDLSPFWIGLFVTYVQSNIFHAVKYVNFLQYSWPDGNRNFAFTHRPTRMLASIRYLISSAKRSGKMQKICLIGCSMRKINGSQYKSIFAQNVPLSVCVRVFANGKCYHQNRFRNFPFCGRL